MITIVFNFAKPILSSMIIYIFNIIFEHSLTNIKQVKQIRDTRVLSFTTLTNKYYAFDFIVFALVANFVVFTRFTPELYTDSSISLFIIEHSIEFRKSIGGYL